MRLQQSGYPTAKLLEVNAAGLLDKFIGQSQAIIGAVFRHIVRLATNSACLCFVLIDEIESIACARRDETPAGNREIMRACQDYVQQRSLY